MVTTHATTPAPAPTARGGELAARWVPAGLAVTAVAIRLPAYAASRHLTFDDGVFGASAVAMRDGGAPFRDVFSSQGPLFLPLVWLFDLLGLRTLDSPRLVAMVAGVVVTLGAYTIGRRLAGWRIGTMAALAVTVSGSILWTTGPVAADGPGLAFSVSAVAIALAYRDHPTRARAVAVGALAGASFTIKSLFALPAGLAIAWVLLERRAWRDLATGVSASAVVVLAVTVPWGISEVWDQSVAYHLEAADDRTPGANVSKVVSTLWDRDLLVLGLAVVALPFAARTWLLRAARGEYLDVRPGRWGGAAAPVLVWLTGVVLVYLIEHPLWRPHLSHVVPPLALAALYAAREHLRVVGVIAAALAVAHVTTVTGILWPGGYEGSAARAAAALERLPDDAWAISDEPGFVWRAGLRTPDDLVDASILRIESGRLTAASLTDAAADPRVCAVLVWSQRFERFDLAPRLAPIGYAPAQDYDRGRALYLRPPCALEGA